MKGMGTPSSSNMMERMDQTSYGNGNSSDDDHSIALLAADGCGEASAKCPHQESEEGPIHRMRHGLARGVGGLDCLGKSVIHSFFSLGFADSCSCRYDLGQIALVARRNISFAQAIQKNQAYLAAKRSIILGGPGWSGAQQRIHEIFIGTERAAGSRGGGAF